MLSQVFLPMMTTFDFPSGAAEVTRAKYFISLGSLQGRRPAWPIPLAFVAATMMVIPDIKAHNPEMEIKYLLFYALT
jgi:hypothetical protein